MPKTEPITNSADLIDSRDVIARIRELESDKEAGLLDAEDEELPALLALQAEAEGCSEWTDGATLIRDSYFQQYAEELADDIGTIDKNATWPVNCIDWEKAAEELKVDYTSVDFDGVEYWVRS